MASSIELNYEKIKKFYCFYSMRKGNRGYRTQDFLVIELSIKMIPIVLDAPRYMNQITLF